MVGNTLTKPEDIAALGKLYQNAKDFESRQEYFLRLLDYFWFSEHRFIGMKRSEVEQIFGTGSPALTSANQRPQVTRLHWSGGRDTILVSFEGDIATGAFYAIGY
jgi:hypothetical protein